MPDQARDAQTETIKLLASIQTTNEFILKGMTELKTEMGKVGEVVQAHAVLLQVHTGDIAVVKKIAEDAGKTAEEAKKIALDTPDLKDVENLKNQMSTLSAPAKTHWSGDNIKVILAIGSVVYLALEIIKLLIVNALSHPAVAPAAGQLK